VRTIRDQVANLRADLTGAALLALRGSGRSPAAIEAQLRTLESRYSVARDRAMISSPSSAPVEESRPVELDRVRRLLPARVALLEFGLLPGKLAAFIVTRDSVQLKSWPAEATALRRDVLRLRRALQTPESATELREATTDLSQFVFAPIAGSIPANVDRLVIVPVAELHQVPFQALRMPAGEYLADRFAISYSPSASALASLGREDRQRGTLLLAAIGNVSSEGMPPLPGTLHEAESIAQLQPGARIIEQAHFTHDAALRALDQFDEVHFATHGILDQDAPMFSALLTSPAQGQPSRLSLLELLDRKIRSRLVVMSACETGLGRMSAGDEITGLTRTFLAAGARVVVSSLWKVSDESTATLMQEFYRGMRSGMPPAGAMRAAELKARKQYPHPFYWAPFVVNGAI
jgi:CHAT domain-containing protein